MKSLIRKVKLRGKQVGVSPVKVGGGPVRQKASRAVGIVVVLGVAYLGIHFIFASHAAVPIDDSPTVSMCGERTASDVEQATGPALPANPLSSTLINNTALNVGISNFQLFKGSGATPDTWYVRSGQTFRLYDAGSGALLKTFTIPATSHPVSQFTVDPASGDVYVANQTAPQAVYRYTTDGTQVWTVNVNGPLDKGVYGYGTGSDFRVAAPVRGVPGSSTWNSSGTPQASNIVSGMPATVSPNGDIVTDDGEGIHVYNSTGTVQKFYMGTTLATGAPGPFHFYSPGGAVELPDGDIAVMDGTGLMLFDSTGVYKGKIASDQGAGHHLEVIQPGTPLEFYNNQLYFISGHAYGVPQNLSGISVAVVDQAMGLPQGAPFNLGIGAGPFTNQPQNYFPAGTTPQVYLQFYPWWSAESGAYTGEYTIRSEQQVLANQSVTPTPFTLNGISSTNVTDIPVQLPATSPGLYEMNVVLKKNNVVVGADCLRYGVGASGATYNPSTLPGSGDQRQVAMAHQFGQTLVRGNFDLNTFLPQTGNPCSTTLDFSKVDPGIQAAVDEAVKEGMTYELQLASGGTGVKNAVFDGCWQNLVQQTVTHFKTVGLASPSHNYVKNWEIWNEANNTFSGDPTTIANSLFKPAIAGIKAADPNATIVAGSLVGVPVSTWKGICKAGGLDGANAIGTHAYTGHNRSFEEQGQVGQLQALQAVLAACGHSGMQIWDTESGFWNNGTNAYYTQGDKLVRKAVLENSIGITKAYNFLDEDGYMIDGQVWGLIANGITPGGMAAITFGHKLGGLNFTSWQNVGAPHTYAALYGSGSNQVAVAWADDYSVDVVPHLSGGGNLTVTDEWGNTTTLQAGHSLTLTGQVHYIDVPAGQTLTWEPAESYDGTDYALASQGTTASATSSTSVNTPAKAIDGITDTQGLGNNQNGISDWIAHYTDTDPQLTITFPSNRTIDRVYISSQGLGSVETGLRSYDVEVDDGTGSFHTVAQVRNDFFAHNRLVTFAAQTVKQIRLTNMEVNYSGYGDGRPPTFWPTAASSLDKDDVWTGQTTVYEVEAFAPGTAADTSGSSQPTTPAAPTNVTATLAAGSQVNLSWTAGSGGDTVTGYKVYRNGTLLATVTGTSYKDTTTVADTAYSYQVSAIDDSGNETTKVSANPASIQTPPAADTVAPTAPTNVTDPLVTASAVTLTWTASTDNVGVVGYHIALNGVDEPDVHTTSLTDSCVAPGNTYTYTITAYDAAGNESPPVTRQVTTLGGTAGDLNCDDQVNSVDLFTLLRNWQKTNELPSAGDLNGDTQVNATDLFTLLRYWGQ